jgi:hypothetical protein
MDKLFVFSIEPIEPSAFCSNPKHTQAVFVNRQDYVVAQTIGVTGIVLVADEPVPFGIKLVESTCRPNPERALLVLVKRVDGIAAQAVGVPGNESVMSKLLCVSIESVKSLTIRPNP